jgi:kynurenine formamidase
MKNNILLLSIAFSLSVIICEAQSREKGPWWPHPLWGPNDQAGGSNWITPEKILEAISVVKDGKLYELGQVYEYDMPFYGTRSYEFSIPPSFGPFGSNEIIGNEENLSTQIGQVGTQFDGPGHIGKRIKYDDGREVDVYYNGFTAEEVFDSNGLKKLGIEHVKPIISTGILVDIAAYKGLSILPNSYEVTPEDIQGALKFQGMTDDDLQPGDIVLLRYGWSQLWEEPEKYNENPPGIGVKAAQWMAGKQLAMVGSDTFTTEVLPNPDSTLAFPVHQELITKNGVWNLENLNLETLSIEKVYQFLFIFTPVPFKGATGSPGRPIAIR